MEKVLAMHTREGTVEEGFRGSKLEEIFLQLTREDNK